LNKAEVILSVNFVADFEATKKIMPAVGSLNNPAAGGMFSSLCLNVFGFSPLRNVNLITAPLTRTTGVGVIVSFVSAQILRMIFRRRTRNDSRI